MTKALMNGAGAVLLALAASAVTAQVGGAADNMTDNEMSYNNSVMMHHGATAGDHGPPRQKIDENATEKGPSHTPPGPASRKSSGGPE